MNEWKHIAQWGKHKLTPGMALELQNAEGERMQTTEMTKSWHQHKPHGWKSSAVRFREVPVPPPQKPCDDFPPHRGD